MKAVAGYVKAIDVQINTQESNGVTTEPGDPIYENHYNIVSLTARNLVLRDQSGTTYRLSQNVARLPPAILILLA